MTTIRWDDLTRNDVRAIGRIVARACAQFPNLDYMTLDMDISAAHINQPLNLAKFEDFKDLDFFHDVFGIGRYIDRATGELDNCFSPRCSSRKGAL